MQAHQSIPGAAQRFLTFMPDNQHSPTIHIQKIHQNNNPLVDTNDCNFRLKYYFRNNKAKEEFKKSYNVKFD